jgi:uncharacterized membrane protein YccC
MNAATSVLGPLASVLAGAGFASVVFRSWQQRRAERKLVKSIEAEESIVEALELMGRAWERNRPGPEDIANARNLIDIAAQGLSENEKRNILRLLVQGSEKSQANYLAKLIDEVDVERARPYEEAQRAS